MPLPDFADPILFPSFRALPDVASAAAPSGNDEARHFLLGQITENMTITRPTLILTDYDGASFALMFAGEMDLKARGLKKGNTAVVPRARKIPAKKEGGQGFIAVDPEHFDEVKALPGSLERVSDVWFRMKQGEEGDERCTCCGKEGLEEGLRKCKGCGGVRYCGKVSWMSMDDCDGS